MSKRTGGGIYRLYFICLAISLLGVVVLSMITAAILSASTDPTGRIGIFSLITLILSACLGGLVSSGLNPTEKPTFPLTVALGVSIVMLISGVILTAGHLSLGAFMNYGCYFGCYALLSYFGGKGGRSKKRRKRR